jgi:hypothetical protein
MSNSAILELLAEAHRLKSDERVCKSESGRILVNFLNRVCEVLAYGEARSVLPPRHHE